MKPTRPHKSEFLPLRSFISQGDGWHCSVGYTLSQGLCNPFPPVYIAEAASP